MTLRSLIIGLMTCAVLIGVSEPLWATTNVPPVLDPAYRHHKQGQWEFAPYGGGYLGQRLGQTWTAGGRLHYHLNNTWAFGANYSYIQVAPDGSSNFGSSIQTRDSHMTNAEFAVSNDAALRIGSTLVEMDFYATLGVGAMRVNADWEPTGLIGGGVKFYTGSPWFAFTVDVNSYPHFTNQPGGAVFDFDTSFTAGFSLLFPAGERSPWKTMDQE